MKTLTFFTAALILASASQGWSQTAGAPASANPPAAIPPPAPASSDTSVKIQDTSVSSAPALTKGKDTLSVDFPDEDIRTILRNVADLFELNLVIPDTLQGKTSIKLRDVTWRQIYQVVLSPVGYTYVEDGNIIKIVSLASLQQEPVTTEVFILNYARATDISPTISSLVDASKGGKLVVDSRSNALVITERPSRMKEISAIIQDLDKATAQVMIETKFVEVTDADIKNIGVNWSSLSGYGVSAGPFNRTYGDNASRTTGSGYNNNNTTNNTANNTGGTAGSNNTTNGTQVQSGTQTQVITSTSPITGNTNVQVLQIPTDTNLTSSGTAVSNTSTTNTTASNTATTALNNLASLAYAAGVNRASSAVFSADQFSLILSALKSLNDTKLVSNPTVVTLNNTKATINIGEEFPIPNYSYNQERGTFEVSGFTYKKIGIILDVTPQVNAAGFIKLSVNPEVSSVLGTTTFGGAGGAQIPILSTRNVQTEVSLKDGYTMGIGGLMQDSKSNGQTKVPVLGSIPFLGRLFRSDSTNNTSQNLIVFITAKTISSDGAPVQDIFSPEMIRSMSLRKSDLPGYRESTPAFLPENPPAK